MPNQTIGALGEELMRRELARNPEQFKPKEFNLGLDSGPDMGNPMSPERAATLGGLADAASTYSFLKRGTGVEGNALLRHLGNRPAATSLGVLGSMLAMKGARGLMRKAGWNGLADTLAGVQGASQMGIAANNLKPNMSSERETGALLNNAISGVKR